MLSSRSLTLEVLIGYPPASRSAPARADHSGVRVVVLAASNRIPFASPSSRSNVRPDAARAFKHGSMEQP
jgi:hypothetical protein